MEGTRSKSASRHRGSVDFFVSYVGADQRWAEWIAWQLEEAGYRVVIQAWDFRPGSDFVADMRLAAVRAERTLAVLSTAYFSSRFASAEWNAAFAADPIGEAHTLVPVRVAEVALDGLDRTRLYVDLVGLEEAAARGALLAGVRRDRAKPAAPPAFPAHRLVGVGTQPRFPGALPPHWNVPHHANPNFCGREEALGALVEALGTPSVVAVIGMGGVGKTQLAVEYAYRHRDSFDVVWWVRAEESTATALSDYAELGKSLGLVQSGELNLQRAADVVRAWLERHDRWLVVFDNALNPVHVAQLTPRGGGGTVLITSQGHDWGNMARVVDLDVLDSDHAAALLRRRSGDPDQPSAAAIAVELGCLPLALEQAGALVAQTPGLTLRAYLDLIQTRSAELLARAQPQDYSHTVATTWRLGFDRIEATCPVAGALLRAIAFLGPEDIPTSLLSAGAQELPSPLGTAAGDPVALVDALAALARFSFVRPTGADAVRVHRLVQRVAREDLSSEDRQRWAGCVVRAVARALPDDNDDVSHWKSLARLVPHVESAAMHAEAQRAELQLVRQLRKRLIAYRLARSVKITASTIFIAVDEGWLQSFVLPPDPPRLDDGSVLVPIIEKGTFLPVQARRSISVRGPELSFALYAGNDRRRSEKLGIVIISPLDVGVETRVELTFTLDQHGMCDIEATCPDTDSASRISAGAKMDLPESIVKTEETEV